MDYALFMVWCFTVALAGGLVGLVLGNIRLPATLLIASSAAAGTGANLIISAAAAGTAAIAHLRAGRINWRLFAWMAPPSIAGAVAGGYLSGVLPRNALLAVIAAVLLYSSYDLARWTPPERRPEVDGEPELDIAAAVGAGAVIGFLGGVVGLILGSLRMPALLKVVGEVPSRAAGTNLAVGFWVGIFGALGHLPSAPPDWKVAGLGAAASIPGALLGARLTGRLSEVQLVRAIAGVLLVAGIATAVEAVA
ncbi:MAG: uncharacterized protein QOI62_2753 [Solirubrobacteraceae bacterium]|nr:uncharacterized protein [Solirubrobacteraceae bacterium]MEA2275962.1 uncharacterized protein [Solirubrobacteraceae bacterium]MEA2359493.1 uncharacterized protein [Solirubrobacteraceae bacterium]MEA2395315.1 uncharacterized protein [Solirubrobacteraceae bacterium]